MSLIYQHFTPNMINQYFDSYVETLKNLVPAGEQTPEIMKTNLQKMLDQGTAVYIALDTERDEIVGTITVLIEQKLTRGGAQAAHIEEIIARKGYQGQGIGGKLVQLAIDYAKQQGCYKIIGDTRDELVPRFAKFGFDSPERMIRKYLDPEKAGKIKKE